MTFVLPHTRQPQVILKEIMYTFLCLSKGSFLPLHHRVCRICLAPVLSRRPGRSPASTRSAPLRLRQRARLPDRLAQAKPERLRLMSCQFLGICSAKVNSCPKSEASRGVSLLTFLGGRALCHPLCGGGAPQHPPPVTPRRPSVAKLAGAPGTVHVAPNPESWPDSIAS